MLVTVRPIAGAGEDTDGGLVEFSADPKCDPMSRKQWAKANPSFPKRTPESSMLRMAIFSERPLALMAFTTPPAAMVPLNTTGNCTRIKCE